MSDPNKELTPEQLTKIAGGINRPVGSSSTTVMSSSFTATQPVRPPAPQPVWSSSSSTPPLK